MSTLIPSAKDGANEWRGMTLEQIQMQRALVQARMEIQKFKIATHLEAARKSSFFGEGSLLSRFSGVFTFAEYGVMAFKLVKTIAPIFRRRKS